MYSIILLVCYPFSVDSKSTLLWIDNLYKHVPEDLKTTRALYPYFNPKLIDNAENGVMFLKIAASKEPTSGIKHRLNEYINIKYNFLWNSKSFSDNMKQFEKDSRLASQIVDEILLIGKVPGEIINVLKESEHVRKCHDFYELLCMFNMTNSERKKNKRRN